MNDNDDDDGSGGPWIGGGESVIRNIDGPLVYLERGRCRFRTGSRLRFHPSIHLIRFVYFCSDRWFFSKLCCYSEHFSHVSIK